MGPRNPQAVLGSTYRAYQKQILRIELPDVEMLEQLVQILSLMVSPWLITMDSGRNKGPMLIFIPHEKFIQRVFLFKNVKMVVYENPATPR